MSINFIDRQSDLDSLLPKLMEKRIWGLDVETTGLDPYTDKIQSIQIGNEEIQHIIDVRALNINPIKPFFENKDVKKICHNAAFEWKMFKKNYNIDVEPLRCTYLAERIINNGKKNPSLSLEEVLQKRLGVALDKTVVKTFNDHKGPFTHAQINYMADDVKYLLPLSVMQCKEMAEFNLGLTWVIECEAIAPFESMCLNGFRLDKDAWTQNIKENEEKIKRAKEVLDSFVKEYWASDMMGNILINYDSPTQMLELLRNKMRIQVQQWNPNTNRNELSLINNTDAKTLKQALRYPVVENLLRYRSLQRLNSTYGQTFIDAIRKDTGLLHFALNQLGTETGRPTSAVSSSYNPLSIPKDVRYRRAFIADDDYVIETDDYSAFEIRIWAEFSKDPCLREALLNGVDIHTYAAQKIMNIRDVDPTKRGIAKQFNFGIVFGMFVNSLYQNLIGEGFSISETEVRVLYNQYTKEFKVGMDFLRNAGRRAILETGFATTMSGRRRYWNLPHDKLDMRHRQIISKYQLEAGNFPLQGTASDIFKKAMRKVYDIQKRFRSELKNAPYDEIVTMTHKDDSEEFVALKRKAMIEAASDFLKVIPVIVDGKVGAHWMK